MLLESTNSLEILSNLISISDSYITGKPVMQCHIGISLKEKKTTSVFSIDEKIRKCTRCGLSNSRTNTVAGIGSEHPIVLVIGEGPGEHEDTQGEPFVGKAGQLLDKMLSAINLSRNDNCYITNIVKCRPPNNRDPLPEEISSCRSFLDAQIQMLKPLMILTVGRIAIQNLLETTSPISKIHGTFFEYNNIPVLPTYHPSALLRDESLKRPAWEDLKIFRQKLEILQNTKENGGN